MISFRWRRSGRVFSPSASAVTRDHANIAVFFERVAAFLEPEVWP